MIVADGHVASSFTTFIKTENPLPQKIKKLTGVTDETVKSEGEELGTALSHFLEFVGALPLVAHNIHFDISFIDAACSRCGFHEIDNKLIDTLSIARQKVVGLNNFSLKVLSEHFGFHSETYHRALQDCHITHKLYEKLINL